MQREMWSAASLSHNVFSQETRPPSLWAGSQPQRPSTSKSHSQFLIVFLLNPSFGSSCLLALHYRKSWWYWWDQFPKGTGPSFRCPKDKLKYWMSSPISNFSRIKNKLYWALKTSTTNYPTWQTTLILTKCPLSKWTSTCLLQLLMQNS